MKKHLISAAIAAAVPALMSAQAATDGYNFAQPDLKGTARFMSMGGAFGALGGDLSVLSQNPGGIGVYRRNDIGFTVDLDCQNSNSKAFGIETGQSQTKFLLNNIGGVATLRLPSSAVPNLNFGFTYNKSASFNRRYRGQIGGLQTSMSNYVAGIANGNRYTVYDLESTSGYNPYNPQDNGIVPQWLPILGYDSFLINPVGDYNYPDWEGQFEPGVTSGRGTFDVSESGCINEYNLALGGNISNVVFWGMDFGIINMNYNQSSMWGESLDNAFVNGEKVDNSTWKLENGYSATANGFNYKLGIIVKPIQQVRIGFAFHTPTWYNVDEAYQAKVKFNNPDENFAPATAVTNNNQPGANSYSFRTPWKFIFSLATVLDNRLILSADYEMQSFQHMNFSDQGYFSYDWSGGDDWGWDWDWWRPAESRSGGAATRSFDDSFALTNRDIKEYYQTSHSVRIGAEYRVTKNFSVRAGYNFVSSPVKPKIRNNEMTVFTVGTNPAYRLDNNTNYITAGLGFNSGGFYTDLAYVYKNMSSTYHAFTPDPSSSLESPQAKLSLVNNQVVLTCGYKF